MGLTAIVAAAVIAGSAPGYVQAHQQPDGGFAEPGGLASPGLTAWAVLGLRASGKPVDRAVGYLDAHQSELSSPTDVALGVLAEATVGRASEPLVSRLPRFVRPDGSYGGEVNSTAWSILALAQLGRPLPGLSVRYLLRRQSRSGGWAWSGRIAPDSNDTAAVIEALRAARVTGRPIRRGLAYLRRLQNADGGFELSPGRGSDAQSTAWAIQALLAAGARPGAAASAYLARLRRPDGGYRYSRRYTTTPVWVTSQVLPALAGKSFPLR